MMRVTNVASASKSNKFHLLGYFFDKECFWREFGVRDGGDLWKGVGVRCDLADG